nr:glycosyltransferase family 1 protein [uncultured Shimia sp.]
MSRAGKTPTGVDRVELAYLRFVLECPEPCFGLIRTSLGFVLLDRSGLSGVLARLTGALAWGPADRLARVVRNLSPERKKSESDLRRLSLARSRPMFLKRMLRKHVPNGATYFNVGHTNLTERVIWALKHGLNARIAVFVHDTIPLDFPQFQRSGSVHRFAGFLARVEKSADLILCNSAVTKRDIERHLLKRSPSLKTAVAHLGVDLHCSQNMDNMSAPHVPVPFFLCVGTIEPRKNHALLLDVWHKMAAEMDATEVPSLVICGHRGWCNEEVFDRLDQSPLRDHKIFEFSNLSDGQIGRLMQTSAGLLFPSFAEGFGLPPVEATAMGVPVVCGELDVIREILQDKPIYASVTDSYAWEQAILDLARQHQEKGSADRATSTRYTPPTWDAHFNVVLKVT